ncbi:hypothetical protein HNQ92_001283 [Rhabdobacter roseus]|uniref:DUF3494 domain-containing protein n=1 Tax=Rhabdobacter roseus TaxID=1655419 RepID=A0A840TN20_9BACT|nr:ice-binding family protein [Rhabdobacter roseus]MBB5283157.1 hypothetical protein [Rhabdobacter roseus]
MFTAAGAFNNVGASQITGDIGTNVGAFSGFPPGTVVGQIHVADPTSAQAALDVESAYNELSAVTCGSTISPTLGAGQVLTPGVYCIGEVATLNGTLTLDGEGDPNALFIIKIDGALTMGASADIQLINGATWANVYWQINGQVDIGEGSLFRGTILANGAINLLEGSFLEGRGLSRAGAISVSNARVSNSVLAPLPVSLVSFTANVQDNRTVRLAWTTSQESHNKGFMIERSKDMKDFEKVGEVGDVASVSTALKDYRLIDQWPYAGTSYYRLRQTDRDGKTTIYPAISVILRDEAYGVFPNPVMDDGSLTLRLDEPETATVSLHSLNGYVLPFQKTGIQAGNLLLKSTAKLSSGVYIIRVQERGQTRSHRLVIQ